MPLKRKTPELWVISFFLENDLEQWPAAESLRMTLEIVGGVLKQDHSREVEAVVIRRSHSLQELVDSLGQSSSKKITERKGEAATQDT